MKGAVLALARAVAIAACTLGIGAASAAPAQPFGADSFARIRARHAGRPLVVHVWGLSCGPCLGELPKWGALYRERPGMALVLIQADAAPPQAADDMLRAAGLGRAPSYSVSADLDDFARASIDPGWAGELPQTWLISRDGAVTRLRGVADLRQVRRWLDASAR